MFIINLTHHNILNYSIYNNEREHNEYSIYFWLMLFSEYINDFI